MCDRQKKTGRHRGKYSVFLCAMALVGLQPFAASPLTMRGVAHAAQPADDVPNFSGYWMRPEGGNGRMFYPPEEGPGPLVYIDETRAFTIGDHTSPILLPNAADAVKAHGDTSPVPAR